MRIGMILEKNFPPDIRVEKEARALFANGHEVHLLAYARPDVQEPLEEVVEGLPVRRVPPVQMELPPPRRIWNSLRFYLTFQNYYWAAHIECYVHDFELDVLHAHDLPLVGTALSVGQGLGIPVIADLHENYPAAVQAYYGTEVGPMAWLTANPKRWAAYERWAVGGATHVIVVVDEAKQRLMEQYGLSPEKVTVLMNVEDVEYFKGIDLDPEILANYRGAFVVSYLGGSGSHRGLDTAIRAMSYLRDAIPGLKLLLVGPGDAGRKRLQALAEAEGVRDLVEMIGWQPFSKMPSYIQASEVCLVPHRQNPHTDSTIPHKLFQYMLMGKPVVVSNCRPLSRIIEETGGGLVFPAGDPEGLAKQIRILYANKELRQDCGHRGREAVLRRYNWAAESQKLCLLYDSLPENRRKVTSS